MPRAPSPHVEAIALYARVAFSALLYDVRVLLLVARAATSDRHAMGRDDDDFRLRPGKIRDLGSVRPGRGRVGGVHARPTSFTGQIQQAILRAGGDPSRLNGTGKGSGRFNARGRGAAVAAALKNRSPWSRDGGTRTRSRQVAVKARITGKEGVYRPAEHLKRATATIDRIGGGPEAFVRSHLRRLEALRRAGHVERIDADQWRVPADLPERGQAYDLARDRANIRVSVLSPTCLDQQIGHDGATWLDRELTSRQRTVLADEGFGQEVTAALTRRRQWVTDKGYATDLGDGRIRAPKDLIQRLEAGDIERAGKALPAERGREWRPASPGNYVSGQLVGSTRLSSGRFAMIDDGLGFSLVPWRPALEQHIGRVVSGVAMPGGDVDWSLGRKLGLGL
jgi:hypothetical protein